MGSRMLRITSAVVASSMLLAGCSNQEPQKVQSVLSNMQVEILVNPNNLEQRVVAEIYKATLEEEGRDVALIQDPTLDDLRRVELVQSGAANMWIGCTGNLLEAMDLKTAFALEKEYLADQENEDPSGTDWLERTHVELIKSLPYFLTTTDPSSATGCESRVDVDLPQNLVPIFVKDLLDRDERQAVGALTKFLTNEDLDALIEDSRTSGSVQQTVHAWLESNIGASELGSGQDSDSNEKQSDGDTSAY